MPPSGYPYFENSIIEYEKDMMDIQLLLSNFSDDIFSEMKSSTQSTPFYSLQKNRRYLRVLKGDKVRTISTCGEKKGPRDQVLTQDDAHLTLTHRLIFTTVHPSCQ